jgi:hypothetical protein
MMAFLIMQKTLRKDTAKIRNVKESGCSMYFHFCAFSRIGYFRKQVLKMQFYPLAS